MVSFITFSVSSLSFLFNIFFSENGFPTYLAFMNLAIIYVISHVRFEVLRQMGVCDFFFLLNGK